MSPIRILILPCLILSLAAAGWGAGTNFRCWDSYDDFAAGQVKGAAITRDGRLVPAFKFDEVLDTEQPYIFCATLDRQGNAYFGTGHDGKVYRLEPNGKSSVWFDAEEADIFALAVDSDESLFVAASPGGKIYRVTPDGKSELYAELKARYIWSLAVDPAGFLYAGTGGEGKIFKVQKDDAREWVNTSQSHIMCLTRDLEGNLLAGTAPRAYVLRVDKNGKMQSIYRAPHGEIRQLAVDRYGMIYVLGIGPEPAEDKSAGETGPEETPNVAVLAKEETGKKRNSAGSSGDGEQNLLYGAKPPADVSSLVRLGKDLSVRFLWGSPGMKSYCLHLDPDGTVFLGGGSLGRILTLQEDRFQAVMAEAGQQQITALLPARGGILACSSNQGKVFRLSRERVVTGEWLSGVEDAGFISRFGVLSGLTGSTASGLPPVCYFRTGNTQDPDETWSEWAGPYNPAESPKITAPPARFGQIKVVFRSDGPATGPAPWLEQISVSYSQQNQAPRMISVQANPPGVVFQKQPSVPPPGENPDYGDLSTFELPGYIQAGLTRMSMVIQLPKIFQSGSTSLTWSASDPNAEALEFEVLVREATAETWTLLTSGLREYYYNLPRRALPDGQYFFKVKASDAPANADGQARTDEMVSKLVRLDFTPPRLTAGPPVKETGGWRVTAQAADELSPVHRMEYSSDGGKNWRAVFPEDGIWDQLSETASFVAGSVSPDVHLIMVRVMDYCGNVTVSTVVLP